MGHILWNNGIVRLSNLYSPNPGAMRIRFGNACDTRTKIIVTTLFNNSGEPSLPENGIDYIGNTIYGQGSIVGVDNGSVNLNTWCVYKGLVPYTSGVAQIIVSGLVTRTSYKYQVFTYDDDLVYRTDLLRGLNTANSNYRSATTAR